MSQGRGETLRIVSLSRNVDSIRANKDLLTSLHSEIYGDDDI